MGNPGLSSSGCVNSEMSYRHAEIKRRGEHNTTVRTNPQPSQWFEDLKVKKKEGDFSE